MKKISLFHIIVSFSLLVIAFSIFYYLIIYIPQKENNKQLDFSKFSGAWWRHGLNMVIDGRGNAKAQWRIYKWCSDDPTPPCDSNNGNLIISGGRAEVVFSFIKDDVAYGVVNSSNDLKTLDKGIIQMNLKTYGMAELEQENFVINLCSPQFIKLAPKTLQEQSPCGV
jgi:hypothetical protein